MNRTGIAICFPEASIWSRRSSCCVSARSRSVGMWSDFRRSIVAAILGVMGMRRFLRFEGPVVVIEATRGGRVEVGLGCGQRQTGQTAIDGRRHAPGLGPGATGMTERPGRRRPRLRRRGPTRSRRRGPPRDFSPAGEMERSISPTEQTVRFIAATSSTALRTTSCSQLFRCGSRARSAFRVVIYTRAFCPSKPEGPLRAGVHVLPMRTSTARVLFVPTNIEDGVSLPTDVLGELLRW